MKLGVPSGDAFLRGMGAYLHAHEHGSVTAQDLWAALGEARPRSFLAAGCGTFCKVTFIVAPSSKHGEIKHCISGILYMHALACVAPQSPTS